MSRQTVADMLAAQGLVPLSPEDWARHVRVVELARREWVPVLRRRVRCEGIARRTR